MEFTRGGVLPDPSVGKTGGRPVATDVVCCHCNLNPLPVTDPSVINCTRAVFPVVIVGLGIVVPQISASKAAWLLIPS